MPELDAKEDAFATAKVRPLVCEVSGQLYETERVMKVDRGLVRCAAEVVGMIGSLFDLIETRSG